MDFFIIPKESKQINHKTKKVKSSLFGLKTKEIIALTPILLYSLAMLGKFAFFFLENRKLKPSKVVPVDGGGADVYYNVPVDKKRTDLHNIAYKGMDKELEKEIQKGFDRVPNTDYYVDDVYSELSRDKGRMDLRVAVRPKRLNRGY